VRTPIAHDPPNAAVLSDREYALAACRDIHDTYMRSGFGPGMAKFMALSATRARFRTITQIGPIRIQPCSGCRLRTTEPGTTH
jgi:hypothetical protein